MKVVALVAIFLLAGVFSQQTLTDMNQCAKSTLGNSLPTEKSQCFQDTSVESQQCCFASISMQGLNVNVCSPILKGVDVNEVETQVEKLLAGSKVNIVCSATSMSLSLILISFVALLLF